jgi:hypothetical protein
MSGLVEYQQCDSGIRVQSFECMNFPELTFIGLEKDLSQNTEELKNLLRTLDKMNEYRCVIDYDTRFLVKGRR